MLFRSGVGGRHDATNALDPIVSVITPISFDHVDVIGPTIADIAYEKAGVMRPGRPVILGRQPADARATLKTEAREVGARDAWLQSEWAWSLRGEHLHVQGPEIAIDGLAVPLRGTFQCDNATAAVAALCATGMVAPEMVDQAVRGGLQSLSWPGRVHVVNQAPIVVFDGAHNAESADQLVSALQSSFGKRRAHWLLGMSRPEWWCLFQD